MYSAKILVVDDEKYIRNFVKQALERQGHTVVLANSGREGLTLFQEDVFDLVLTDVKMPDMDGIEMLRHIRKMDATVVAVVITAMQDQQTAVRALECGAHDFLIKPFMLDELTKHVAQALDERDRIVGNRLLIGDLMQTQSVLQKQLLEQDEKLSQTERYLKHLIDAAPFGVISTDKESVVLTFNNMAEKMYGYKCAEILGRSVTCVFGDCFSKGYTTHVRKDGRELPVLVHKKDIVNDLNEEIAHLYVLEDRSEREMLESQLFQAERLSLLGQMAPRIAHEFKTPLQLVSGNTELTKTWLEQGDIEQALKTLEHILPATKQLLYMVQQMTNLGKPEKKRQEAIDLIQIINGLLSALQPLGVVKYCQVERKFAPEVSQIFGDPSQIEQIIRNLIVNAAQAMESSIKKILTITVEETQDAICVHIQDTGHGIPMAKLEEIFQPFYTTKPEGKGTGLGLAIVHSMLKRHKADVHVDSVVDVGTTFRLAFPIYKSEVSIPNRMQANA